MLKKFSASPWFSRLANLGCATLLLVLLWLTNRAFDMISSQSDIEVGSGALILIVSVYITYRTTLHLIKEMKKYVQAKLS